MSSIYVSPAGHAACRGRGVLAWETHCPNPNPNRGRGALAWETHCPNPNPNRGRVKLAWETHYPGNVRSIHNTLLETYMLKSMDLMMEVKSMDLTMEAAALQHV